MGVWMMMLEVINENQIIHSHSWIHRPGLIEGFSRIDSDSEENGKQKFNSCWLMFVIDV